jgi:hypothetical protein
MSADAQVQEFYDRLWSATAPPDLLCKPPLEVVWKAQRSHYDPTRRVIVLAIVPEDYSKVPFQLDSLALSTAPIWVLELLEEIIHAHQVMLRPTPSCAAHLLRASAPLVADKEHDAVFFEALLRLCKRVNLDPRCLLDLI